MATKLRLTGDSSGTGVAIVHAPSGVGGTTFTLPSNGNSTLLTSNSGLDATKLTGNLPVIDGSSLTGIDALPSQSGHSGKFLKTVSNTASWAALDTDSNSTSKPFYEHHATVSIDHTITTNYNAVTVGPITINATKSVTVPSGSTWVIL